MPSITFDALLARTTESAGLNREQLTKQQDDLSRTITKLESELARHKTDLAHIKDKLQTPLKQALQAAKLLGIDVPEEYQNLAQATSTRTNGGEYLWQADPLPGSTRTSELLPKTMNIARAMWALSRGSGGSAGKSGEGILTSEEFFALLKQQTGLDELKPGQTVELVLPNERHLKVTRSSS